MNNAQDQSARTGDHLRASYMSYVTDSEGDREAVDGIYESINSSHFNDDFSKYVRETSQSRSLVSSRKSQGKVFDDTCYDHENNLDDVEFESVFAPEDMRCLALVAHNHMKPAMRKFVVTNKNVLKKFRLTGTNTTMTMLQEVFGGDPAVKYGPTCQSGPLGGDAELVALMVMEELGGMIFLQDPMDAHPHRADIDCLARQANVHDILQASNPASAYGMMGMLRMALRLGNKGLLASFFETEYSPSVLEFKLRERAMEEKKDPAHHIVKFASLRKLESLDEIESSSPPMVISESTLPVSNLAVSSVGEENTEVIPVRSLHKEQSLGTLILSIQKENKEHQKRRTSSVSHLTREMSGVSVVAERGSDIHESIDDQDFKSMYLPEEMRILALVAHNHMEPALRRFIITNKNLLRKFVLTGNKKSMAILKDVYGDEEFKHGPVCQSGALGGNAQLCALMCMNELGGLVFFQDPMDAHAHQVDIDCVNRQANVHDIYIANNVSSAYLMLAVLRRALRIGNFDRIAPFFETRKSPSVAEYKKRQQEVSDNLSTRNYTKHSSSRLGRLSKKFSYRFTNQEGVQQKSTRTFLKLGGNKKNRDN